MKISLKWLSEMLDLKEEMKSPQVLQEALTQAGLEVESVENLGAPFRFVVTGLILKKDKHPDADKLSLCQVMTGEGIVHQIVCGAQNHQTNDRVVVALPGAVLPGNFAIKKASVRGVESGGMLCSEKELGLPVTTDGILILPPTAPLGMGFAEYWGLDDIVFEIKVTPNRADCLSHWGLARELACLLKKKTQFVAASEFVKRQAPSSWKIEVQDFKKCSRYSGVFLKNVKVGPSSTAVQRKLETLGLKPINNVVDVTNLILLETGQPIHAFDAQKISGRHLFVRRAQGGESFVSLDGTKLSLKDDDLVIADDQKVLALAGVVGGQNSGVSESTQDLFLEVAHFEAQSVRRTSRAHGIQTDSAYRFSRGVNAKLIPAVLELAVRQILTAAGGEAQEDAVSAGAGVSESSWIAVRPNFIRQKLGFDVSDETIFSCLSRLECEVQKPASGPWQVKPPGFRFDLEQEVDFIEEVGRLEGYHKIPEALSSLKKSPTLHDANFLFRRRVSELLLGLGFSESANPVLTDGVEERNFLGRSESLNQLGLPTSAKSVGLVNPLSQELSSLQASLSFGLWKNMLRNYHQGQESGALFEIGKVFDHNDTGYLESWRLGLILWGEPLELWKKAKNPENVFKLRQILEELLACLGIKKFQLYSITDKSLIPRFLHLGQAGAVQKEGSPLGYFASLHPRLVTEAKVRGDVAMAELNFDLLQRGQPRTPSFQNFSRFPSIERDLALVGPKSLKFSEIEMWIRQAGGGELRSVQLFDVFESESLGAGMRSLTFRLQFQSLNGTLQDDLIQKSVQSILDTLAQKFQLSTR